MQSAESYFSLSQLCAKCEKDYEFSLTFYHRKTIDKSNLCIGQNDLRDEYQMLAAQPPF